MGEKTLQDWLQIAKEPSLRFFGMMLFGAFMIAVGFFSIFATFGLWLHGFGWLAPRGGYLFGVGFFCLMATGLVGVVTGHLK